MTTPANPTEPGITQTEPVSIAVALSTAVTSTLGILLVVGVDPDLVAAVTGAASGWIAVAFMWARGRVTPNARVAMTVEQAQQLQGS